MENLEDAEAERVFMEGGVAGVINHAKEKLDEWKTTEVNIAVVGQSGSGKSSFINTIRDVDDPDDPLFAATGVVETTSEPKSFQFPNNSLIQMWDLPGAGTAKFNATDYAAKMKFWTYDAFVILSCDRFTEIDKMIAKEIENRKKPFFFARTKMDNVMRDEKRNKKKHFDRKGTKEEIIVSIQRQLEGAGQEKIYLIVNLPGNDEDLLKHFPDNDNKRLKEAIVENLPDMQKNAIVLSLVADSEKMIKFKAEEIASRFKWLSLLSAAGGAIPLPGSSACIDTGILVSEAFFQKKQLGIDDNTINERAHQVGLSKGSVLLKIRTSLKSNEKKSSMMGNILNVMSHNKGAQAAAMLAGLSVQVAVSEAIQTGAVVALPILGMLISGAISGGKTYFMLTQMLNAHLSIALECMKVLSPMAIDMKK